MSVKSSSSSELLAPRKLQASHVLTNDKGDVFSVRFTQDGRLVAGSRHDGTINVYNATSGEKVFILAPPNEANPMPVTCIRWRPEVPSTTIKGVLLAAGADGVCRQWHVPTMKMMGNVLERGNQIFCLDYRDDAEKFVAAGKDGKVRLYDETTKKVDTELSGGAGESGGHTSRVFSVKFNPTNQNLLISGGWDNTVQICGDSLDMTSDNTIVTGSWRPRDVLQLWDFGSGQLMRTFDWKAQPGSDACLVYGAQYNHTGTFIAAGGSGSNEAKLFHKQTGHCVAEISGSKKGLFSVHFSPDDKTLAIGGGDLMELYDISDFH